MPKRHPVEKVEQYLELAEKQVPLQQIAEMIDIPYWTIMDWHTRKTRPDVLFGLSKTSQRKKQAVQNATNS